VLPHSSLGFSRSVNFLIGFFLTTARNEQVGLWPNFAARMASRQTLQRKVWNRTLKAIDLAAQTFAVTALIGKYISVLGGRYRSGISTSEYVLGFAAFTAAAIRSTYRCTTGHRELPKTTIAMTRSARFC
jgi:hypothetical protein